MPNEQVLRQFLGHVGLVPAGGDAATFQLPRLLKIRLQRAPGKFASGSDEATARKIRDGSAAIQYQLKLAGYLAPGAQSTTDTTSDPLDLNANDEVEVPETMVAEGMFGTPTLIIFGAEIQLTRQHFPLDRPARPGTGDVADRAAFVLDTNETNLRLANLGYITGYLSNQGAQIADPNNQQALLHWQLEAGLDPNALVTRDVVRRIHDAMGE